MQAPLTHHHNLEIEDILDKLYSVTQESDPNELVQINGDQSNMEDGNLSQDS